MTFKGLFSDPHNMYFGSTGESVLIRLRNHRLAVNPKFLLSGTSMVVSCIRRNVDLLIHCNRLSVYSAFVKQITTYSRNNNVMVGNNYNKCNALSEITN